MDISKKNRFIVIGNGFDLFCGLKSGYRDFFNHLGKKRFDSFLDQIIDADSPTKKEDRPPSIVDSNLIKSVQNNESREIAGAIFARFSKLNFWALYFLVSIYSDKSQVVKNWMDIENLIKIFFKSPCKTYSYFDHLSASTPNHDLYHGDWRIDLLDFALKKCDHKGCKTTAEFVDLLLGELKKFEKLFGKYISSIQLKQEKYPNKALGLIELLRAGEHLASIDSFNYSDPFRYAWYRDKVRHIHGEVDNPIFGINVDASESESEDDPAYIFTKKSRQLELDDQNSEISFPEVDEVIFFGQSFNAQDQGYFQGLFDLLRIRDLSLDKPKLIFAYCAHGKLNEKEARVDMLRKVTNLFKRYEKNKGDDNIMQALIVANRIEFELIEKP